MLRRVLKASDGSLFEVFIGYPTETDKGDFACSYIIKGSGPDLNAKSIGLDSVQALMLSLKSIGSQLNLMQETESITIYWLDQQSGYGFPSI